MIASCPVATEGHLNRMAPFQGGAARAIAVELALAGAAEITIVNRNLERAEALAHTVRGSTATSACPVRWTGTYEILPATDILINATSVGLAPRVDERLDLAMDTLRSHMVVCDVIMNPPQTNLLRTAAAHGAAVLDGRGMLVNQAALEGFKQGECQSSSDISLS
jgi:shikimate dehydrogenase